MNFEICKMCNQQKNMKEIGRGIGYCWECRQKVEPPNRNEYDIKKLL